MNSCPQSDENPQDPVSRVVQALREQASPTPSLLKNNKKCSSTEETSFDDEETFTVCRIQSPLNNYGQMESVFSSPDMHQVHSSNRTPLSESPFTKQFKQSICKKFDQDYKKVLLEHEIEYKAKIRSVRNITFMTVLLYCIYLALGVLYYSIWSKGVQWPMEETLIFLTYTASTVGYGNHSIPSSPTDRAVTSIFLLSGIALVTVLLSEIFQYFVIQASRVVSAHEEEEITKVMSASKTERCLVWNSTTSAIFSSTSCLKDFLSKFWLGRIFMMTLPFIFLIVLGASIVGTIEQWSFIDSIYWALVTLSTVGYGDLTPSKPRSIWFCIFFLPLSTIFISFYLSKVAGAYMKLHIKEIRRIESRLKRQNREKLNDSKIIEQVGSGETHNLFYGSDYESTEDNDCELGPVVRKPMKSSSISMKDVLNTAIKTSKKVENGEFIAISPTPSLPLRSVALERFAFMIAKEFTEVTPSFEIKDGTAVMNFQNWMEVIKRWKIPMKARDPLKAAVCDIILSVGINNIRLEGVDALLGVKPDQFQRNFHPVIAALGTSKCLDAWIISTKESITEEY